MIGAVAACSGAAPPTRVGGRPARADIMAVGGTPTEEAGSAIRENPVVQAGSRAFLPLLLPPYEALLEVQGAPLSLQLSHRVEDAVQLL